MGKLRLIGQMEEDNPRRDEDNPRRDENLSTQKGERRRVVGRIVEDMQ